MHLQHTTSTLHKNSVYNKFVVPFTSFWHMWLSLRDHTKSQEKVTVGSQSYDTAQRTDLSYSAKDLSTGINTKGVLA
jgi:hypothetical protein